MILLQTHQLDKSYGATPILSQVNLEIHSGDRIGLVGANGAGKSTLLKILAGDLSYDGGKIFSAKHVHIGYLAQDTGLHSEATIGEEMKQVFAHFMTEEKRLRAMERQMADLAATDDDERYQTLMDEYAQASEAFRNQGGYEYEAKIDSVLHGLRFSKEDHKKRISTLSGGQKTRLALGKLLLQQPDILMLDEPTNYLDLETLSWLEQYLLHYSGAMLIVSHDRYFLDQLTTIIYEIDGTTCTKYTGNYTRFLEQKEAAYEQQLKHYTKQQKQIKEMEEFVQRNIARDSTSNRAKSRRKELEKMERIERPHTPPKKASFRFRVERPSGYHVLKVDEVSIGYQGIPLAQSLSFQVYKGDRLAILGPNGSGKSTLLKTIMGHIPPLKGDIHKGAHVSIAYYDQEQRELDEQRTVLEEIRSVEPYMQEKDARTLLGQFLFSGEDVFKKVANLSGGEKARVSIAKLILKKANVLMMDEPTNHLDIASKEVLEKALVDYPGTLIFVSHDRYFLNRIATKVSELQPQGTNIYLGNYDYYLFKKEEEKQIAALNTKQGQTLSSQQQTGKEQDRSRKQQFMLQKEEERQKRKQQRRKQKLEEEIDACEQTIQTLHEQLYSPDVYEDHHKAGKVQKQLDEHEQRLDELIEQWSDMEDG